MKWELVKFTCRNFWLLKVTVFLTPVWAVPALRGRFVPLKAKWCSRRKELTAEIALIALVEELGIRPIKPGYTKLFQSPLCLGIKGA